MANDNLPPWLHTLLQAECYPHPAPDIRLVQTHISYVLLVGDFVYKFKKPVNFGFLDFSAADRRHHFCEQELLLNRRLCPDLYLGLVEVTEENGGFALNGGGRPVEWGVRMRRMPEERMMVNLIRAGGLLADHIDALVEVLAEFYRRAEGGEGTAIRQRRGGGGQRAREFRADPAFPRPGRPGPGRFDRIAAAARDFLDRRDLFRQRIDEGRIRDCHGDLYSANICLADKVYIYDCIEFNERFRFSDVASDVAFLAMDLDFHGLEALSQRFIDRFVARTNDSGLLTMLDFYKGYRAYLRGKIGLFTAADPAVDAGVRAACLEDAARYFTLAERYAAR